MKAYFVLIFCTILGITVFAQDDIIKKNTWTTWKADSIKTQEGNLNVIKKRLKITSNDCLITEEIIFFHDDCNNIIRKIKIRSDCKRNIGEGQIIYERKYKRNCTKK